MRAILSPKRLSSDASLSVRGFVRRIVRRIEWMGA